MPHTNDHAYIEARIAVTGEGRQFLERLTQAPGHGLTMEPTDDQARLETALTFGGRLSGRAPNSALGAAYLQVTSPRPDHTVIYVNAPSNAISSWLRHNWDIHVNNSDWAAGTELRVPTPWFEVHIAPTTEEEIFPRAFALQGGPAGLVIVQDFGGAPTRPVLPSGRVTTATLREAPGAFLTAFALRHLGVLESLTGGLLHNSWDPANHTLEWDHPLQDHAEKEFSMFIALLELSVDRSHRVQLSDLLSDREITLIDTTDDTTLKVRRARSFRRATLQRPAVRGYEGRLPVVPSRLRSAGRGRDSDNEHH